MARWGGRAIPPHGRAGPEPVRSAWLTDPVVTSVGDYSTDLDSRDCFQDMHKQPGGLSGPSGMLGKMHGRAHTACEHLTQGGGIARATAAKCLPSLRAPFLHLTEG